MIICKTPYRVSLFGGSTDYANYYEEYGSLLIGFALKQYNYTTIRYTPKLLSYKTKVSYSQTEYVDDNRNIKNNAARGVLEFLGISDAVEITHMSDLPAQTGIGSSSSFIVGLLNAAYSLMGEPTNKEKIAKEAVYIERVLLDEPGGCQDSIWASYGGLNSIHIDKTGEFDVRPLPLSQEFTQKLMDRSIMVYTGNSRQSFDLARSHKPDKKEIHRLAKYALLSFYECDLNSVARLLGETWEAKKAISDQITTPEVDAIYNDLKSMGMIGGKLLGAGGSGFIFGILSEDFDGMIYTKYGNLMVPVGIDYKGSNIL
jgi:D-glycero-alpha-D-manno-heptose-7-phosphate kinase